MYDVIVVGAGPAGCTAAKAITEKGYKVLLMEKFKMPRYKSCSGVLIKKSMELVKKYFGEAVPESAMCTPTDNRGMVFTNDADTPDFIGKVMHAESVIDNTWMTVVAVLLKKAVLAIYGSLHVQIRRGALQTLHDAI